MEHTVTRVHFDPELFPTLHISHWVNASFEQRLAALQQLEEYQARLQGRAAVTINLTKELPNNFSAQYIAPNKVFQPRQIIINESILNQSEPYPAVYLLLHEGRHAYQDAFRQKPTRIKHDQEEVQLWRKNLGFGYLWQYPDYVLQPVEHDALKYSLAEMKRIYNVLAQRFGENEQLNKFIEDQQDYYQSAAIEAEGKYGNDYLAIIVREVKRKFELIEQFYRTYKITKDDKFYRIISKIAEDFVDKTSEPDVSYEGFEQLLRIDATFLKALGWRKRRRLMAAAPPNPSSNDRPNNILENECERHIK